MDNLPLNIVDMVVAIVLLVSALLAYARGFVHELLSVAGWIGAGVAALYGFPYVKPYARDLIPMDLAADLAAGASIFIFTLVVLSLLSGAIAKSVQASALNALDRALGFLFGALRGAILICLAYLAVEWVLPKEEQPQWIRTARSMPLIETGSEVLMALVPREALDAGANGAETLRNSTQDAMDTQKAVKKMIDIAPKGLDTEALKGYGEKARQEMNKALDNIR